MKILHNELIVRKIKNDLSQYSNKERVKISKRYFKTGKGEYGEGDIFIGVTTPNIKKVIKSYKNIPLKIINKLIKSKVHEERTTALAILVNQYQKSDSKKQKGVFNLYLKNTKYINNWDLVDISASKIVGKYLFDNQHCTTTFKGASFKGKELLVKLAGSENLWERRIAVISTYYFIQHNRYIETIEISKILLGDKHDLIHKAVGWMLREVGKRDLKTEIVFLDKYAKKMPRTCLRYAIEKFSEETRKKYLLIASHN